MTTFRYERGALPPSARGGLPRGICARVRTTGLAGIIGVVAAGALAEGVVAPSGQAVTLLDLILEPEAGLARFRFLAPALDPAGQGLVHDDVAGDFQWLCETVALPEMQAEGWQMAQIVISLSDREVPFGASDPDATQFFEGFSVDGAACIWEPF